MEHVHWYSQASAAPLDNFRGTQRMESDMQVNSLEASPSKRALLVTEKGVRVDFLTQKGVSGPTAWNQGTSGAWPAGFHLGQQCSAAHCNSTMKESGLVDTALTTKGVQPRHPAPSAGSARVLVHLPLSLFWQ